MIWLAGVTVLGLAGTFTACGGTPSTPPAPVPVTTQAPAAPPATTQAPVQPPPTTQAPAPPTTQAPPPAPAPTTQAPPPAPATTSQPDSGFGIGTSYSGKCYVAWPTAPVTTSTTIQMTMSCSGVPSQYALVLVVYGDPSLPVTPSTGAMTVTGVVQDFEQSQMGMTVPIIMATNITIP